MPIYTKRPPLVEARIWDGTLESTASVMGWMHNGDVPYSEFEAEKFEGIITFKEGVLQMEPGDYIIYEGGVFRPITATDLQKNYELVYDKGM